MYWSPALGWAGPAAGPRPGPGQSSAGRPRADPVSPGNRPGCPVGRRSVTRRARGPSRPGEPWPEECARLPEEVRLSHRAQAGEEVPGATNNSSSVSRLGKTESSG